MRAPVALALLSLLMSGCARHRPQTAHRTIPAPRTPTPTPSVGYTETGIASWYGHPYHGRQAADGETYDMETLVAAHRTLPFNTWVRVVNLRNERSVEVRIIDRGPFIEGRIIDLSHAAAQAIGMEVSGTDQVRMEVISTPAAVPAALFAVQVGAFRNRANADRVCAEMQSRYGSARLLERPENPGVFRVIVGSAPTQEAAAGMVTRIQLETGEKNDYVIRLN